MERVFRGIEKQTSSTAYVKTALRECGSAGESEGRKVRISKHQEASWDRLASGH